MINHKNSIWSVWYKSWSVVWNINHGCHYLFSVYPFQNSFRLCAQWNHLKSVFNSHIPFLSTMCSISVKSFSFLSLRQAIHIPNEEKVEEQIHYICTVKNTGLSVSTQNCHIAPTKSHNTSKSSDKSVLPLEARKLVHIFLMIRYFSQNVSIFKGHKR